MTRSVSYSANVLQRVSQRVLQRVWQYAAVCCSVLQCAAVCRGVTRWWLNRLMCCTVCSSVLCSVLQRVAVCCSTNQSGANLMNEVAEIVHNVCSYIHIHIRVYS